MNLFAYGTLMDRRVITRVVGRTLPNAVPATLRGYTKWETTLGYDIILPEPGGEVKGLVYFSLSPADWERLDIYENLHSHPPAYIRRMATAEGTHGNITVQAYVGNLNFFRARIKR